jgi:hypothetical protein
MRRALVIVVVAVLILAAIVLVRRRVVEPVESPAPAQAADRRDAEPAPPASNASEPALPDIKINSYKTPVPKTIGSTATDWRKLTEFDFAALPLVDMPPDDGYVAPIAAEDQKPNGTTMRRLAQVEAALATWAPGRIADPVQRVRNLLLLLGVVDVAQSTLERFLPEVIVRQLLKDVPAGDLARIMCWIALHPDEGDISVLSDPLVVELGELNARTVDAQEARNRTYIYGVKLARRLAGW